MSSLGVIHIGASTTALPEQFQNLRLIFAHEIPVRVNTTHTGLMRQAGMLVWGSMNRYRRFSGTCGSSAPRYVCAVLKVCSELAQPTLTRWHAGQALAGLVAEILLVQPVLHSTYTALARIKMGYLSEYEKYSSLFEWWSGDF